MSEIDLQKELTLRNAEIIRLNEIIILLENMCRNNEIYIKKATTSFEKLKGEHTRLKEREKLLEITEIEVKVLLDELQKIDPMSFS